MKNPLVDALRQAEGDTSKVERASVAPKLPQQQELPEPEIVPVLLDVAPTSSMASADDVKESPQGNELGIDNLDLLSTGTYVQVEPLPNESAAEVESAQEAIEDFCEETKEPGVEVLDEGPTLQEQTSIQHQMLSSTAMLAAQGAKTTAPTPLIPKMGRLTPIICLLALSVSAAGYYQWNQAAAMSLNNDLDGMAQMLPASNISAEGAQLLPLAGQSIFTETHDESMPNTRRNSSRNTPRGVSSEPSLVNTELHRTPISQRSNLGSVASTVNISSSRADEDGVTDKAHEFVKGGYAAYQAGDYDRAEIHYRSALEIEPHHADAIAGIAAIYVQKNRSADALSTYEKLLGVDSSNAIAISGILTIHAADPKSDSESELKTLLQLYPDAHPLHYALGSLYVGKSRWPDAKMAFLAAYAIAPNNANYSYNAAVSMENVGEYDNARIYYEAALATASDESRIDRQAVAMRVQTLSAGRKEQM